MELELKNKDYELVIRKKEALPPPPASQQFSNQGPHVMAHTMYPGFQPQPQPQIQSQPMQEEATPAPAVPSPADSIPLAAEHPPMLSPMAGTFYRSPGPGEPQFVKVSKFSIDVIAFVKVFYATFVGHIQETYFWRESYTKLVVYQQHMLL